MEETIRLKLIDLLVARGKVLVEKNTPLPPTSYRCGLAFMKTDVQDHLDLILHRIIESIEASPEQGEMINLDFLTIQDAGDVYFVTTYIRPKSKKEGGGNM